MPVVICEECRQSVTVKVIGGEAAYQFELNRCTQKIARLHLRNASSIPRGVHG